MIGAGISAWQRRARPLLGTLVELGVRSAPGDQGATFEVAFAAVLEVQQALSRFNPDSDVSRFHALRCGQALRMRHATKAVLAAAWQLRLASDGAFDISLGTAPIGWRCEGDELVKLNADTRLDAGGIAKGYAVDAAVQALIDRGCTAGWVNAGGDLRAFGDVDVPVHVRDESTGGVRRFADLRQGAFATSHFDDGSRSRLVHGRHVPAARAHVSVAAPKCLWADALTKVVAIRGDTSDPILSRFRASAWMH
jgi:FAD:protein FMN transferase